MCGQRADFSLELENWLSPGKRQQARSNQYREKMMYATAVPGLRDFASSYSVENGVLNYELVL